MPVFRHALLVAGGGEPQQSADGDARLCGALSPRSAASCEGRRALAASRGQRWRVDTDEGGVDAAEAVVALGPWAPDVLEPLGIKVPLASSAAITGISAAQGNASLSRPVIDTEYGYALTPMEQGIRLTTGAEFAARDAAPTPVQFDRLMPAARELFPLGERPTTSPGSARGRTCRIRCR